MFIESFIVEELGKELIRRNVQEDLNEDETKILGFSVGTTLLTIVTIVMRIVGVFLLFLAGYLAWSCNASFGTASWGLLRRVFVTSFAAVFNVIYLVYYLIYHNLLGKPC